MAGVQEWHIKRKQQYASQYSLYTILFNKQKGYGFPLYVRYPHFDGVVDLYPEMDRGPHKGLFYVPRVSTPAFNLNFDTLAADWNRPEEGDGYDDDEDEDNDGDGGGIFQPDPDDEEGEDQQTAVQPPQQLIKLQPPGKKSTGTSEGVATRRSTRKKKKSKKYLDDEPPSPPSDWEDIQPQQAHALRPRPIPGGYNLVVQGPLWDIMLEMLDYVSVGVRFHNDMFWRNPQYDYHVWNRNDPEDPATRICVAGESVKITCHCKNMPI